MKNKKSDIRNELDRLVSERNNCLADKMREKFAASDEMVLIREETDYLIGELLKRKTDIDAGRLFQPMWPYDMDNIVRIFSSVTRIGFDGWTYDKSLSDEQLARLGQKVLKKTAPLATYANEYDLRIALIEAYIAYIRSAACLAKHLQSPTARTWAKMLLLLNVVKSSAEQGIAMGSDDTPYTPLRDQQRAADELRVDIVLADIPPFRPTKAANPAASKRKARNGL